MYVDFMSGLHNSTQRDYLARVNDPEFPKWKAAGLAKQWGFDYWDGDRRVNYGGYKYIPGRWKPLAERLIEYYGLTNESAVLDVGCGKGFLLYEMSLLLPDMRVVGLDISDYAVTHAHPEISHALSVGNAADLPFADTEFDLAYSLNTLHNLKCYDLDKALREINRVANKKYVCVESYRNEKEKANLLYWQVTCEAFNDPDEWLWWFETTGYNGDHSFIYFE